MIHPPHRKKSEGVIRYNSDVDDQLGSGEAHHPANVPPVPSPGQSKGGHGDKHKPHKANRHHEEEVLGQTDHPKPVRQG
jgi:hypothetical protein